MMRARNIKPGLFENEVLGTRDPLLTILFQGLWCLADREGRVEDRPLRIGAKVFPYRKEVDVTPLLDELERLGFIERYTSCQVNVIHVVNFLKHQRPHMTERQSELPAKSDSCLLTVDPPLSNGGNLPDLLIPDSLIPEEVSTSASASVPLEQIREQVTLMCHAWPKQNHRGEPMPRPSISQTVEVMASLVRKGNTVEGLCESARAYLEEFHTARRPSLKAPQFFFGKKGYWKDFYAA